MRPTCEDDFTPDEEVLAVAWLRAGRGIERDLSGDDLAGADVGARDFRGTARG